MIKTEHGDINRDINAPPPFDYSKLFVDLNQAPGDLHWPLGDLQWPLDVKMAQIGHVGNQTQWFDLFDCFKLFVDVNQPPGDLQQPPVTSSDL